MGLLSNKLKFGETLTPGDHIYTWRTCHIYSHHGIYVGNNTVIHFTSKGKEPGEGLLRRPKSRCTHLPPTTGDGVRHGVIQTCLDCFLDGDKLYRYRYSVSKAFFVAKLRGGTCTMADSDEDAVVISRANELLHKGFGKYHLFRNNCENFALYCKTGLMRGGTKMPKCGQVSGATKAAVACTVGLVLLATVHVAIPGSVIVPYSVMRLRKDIGVRKDVVKVPVTELIEKIGSTLKSLIKIRSSRC